MLMPISIQKSCDLLPQQNRPRSEKASDGSTNNLCEEARNLAWRCAEPRPVGDNTKAAINRAAQRLGFTYGRTRNIWYGGVRYVDKNEIDVLRACAAAVDIDQGIVGLEVLRARLCTMPSSAVERAIRGIDVVLGLLHHDLPEVA